MNSKAIPFFRRLEDMSLPRTVISSKIDSASFTLDGTERPLNIRADGDGRYVEFADPEHRWNIADHGLRLLMSVSVDGVSQLFLEGGVASPLATLGIGIVCTSAVSDRLDVFKVCTLDAATDPVSIEHALELNPGVYRGDLTLKTVLYLCDDPSDDGRYPKQSGTILGTIGEIRIALAEERMLFPVYEVSEPGAPLWWAVCNWSSVEDDPFTSEFVAVVFNRSHKLYDKVTSVGQKSVLDQGFLAEIMSSAVQVIIEKVKESETEWSRIMSGASFAEGTIAYMVQYMRDTLEWDMSSPEATARSIRGYVYDKMVGR